VPKLGFYPIHKGGYKLRIFDNENHVEVVAHPAVGAHEHWMQVLSSSENAHNDELHVFGCDEGEALFSSTGYKYSVLFW
jgi:hypothetical protein